MKKKTNFQEGKSANTKHGSLKSPQNEKKKGGDRFTINMN